MPFNMLYPDICVLYTLSYSSLAIGILAQFSQRYLEVHGTTQLIRFTQLCGGYTMPTYILDQFQ